MELNRLSLSELAELLNTKAISARECVAYFSERIDRINPSLNAFVSLDFDMAKGAAKTIDEKRAGNVVVGSLAGIPFGVKDLEDAIGFTTTRGSILFADSPKAQKNSHMVQCFVNQGAIPIGKTNTPEFGWKSDTDNYVFGPTRNPHDTGRSPGGSSGGSTAAIAAGLVPFATGSDGGGSLRIPAAACGISAMKTSLGRIPSISDVPTGWSNLSVPGPLAKSIQDTALLLDLVVTNDGRDFRTVSRKVEQWHQEISIKQNRPRVAYSLDLGYSPIDPEIAAVMESALVKLRDAGVEIEPLETLFDHDPIEEFFTMTNAYYAKTLEPFMGHPKYNLVDEGVREQVRKGLTISATEFLRASDLCFHMNRILYTLFQRVDVLISPTTAALPPIVGGVGSIGGVEDPNWVKLTYPFNMTRSPAASVYAGNSKFNLPVGLQIIGPHLGDLKVLSSAQLFEDIFGLRSPNIA